MDDRLRSVFRDVLGIADGEYRHDLGMRDVQAWDSVMHLSLVLAIEQEFNVSFAPEEFETLTSVAGIRKALSERGVH
ncbi:MAG: acyl carrier protein [Phycisphaerae bacterium]|jgi:acyl carrier protein|nr:acyl carrier protein [Phycisphaerae bacterium]MCZ2399178.1 acyl carrier protein [Phycisphaerae bacterium]NUQ50587.1 acyl carrier protein [Phycisphaerae bacterium]